jgi:hypothetical protein
MRLIWFAMWRCRRSIAAIFLGSSILVACTKPSTSVPVNIHGVNYGGDSFTYVVVDPANAENNGGGELIESYAAGGTMCCYELPRKWQPGMTLSIKVTHHLGKNADDSYHDVAANEVVVVPRYLDDKPGEIWVLRGSDGKVDVVWSDYQPDHPNWPGKVKGWPVPSLAYQRERWDIYINHAKGGVDLFEKLLAELNSDPDARAAKAWDFELRDDQRLIAGFSGPDDPKYRNRLRSQYSNGLERSRAELGRYEKGRP